jgi:class 3 adenylate cyclase
MDGLLFDEYMANVAVGGLVASLGIVFLMIQQRTKATIGLAVTFASAGLDFMTIPLLLDRVDPDAISFWERLQVLPEAAFPAGICIYMSGLLVTTQSSLRAEQVIRAMIRVGWMGAALAAVLGFVFPAERGNDFLLSIGEPGALARPGFWIFAGVYLTLTVTFGIAWVVFARQQVDQGEQARAVCNVLASPFMVVSTVLPYKAAVLTFTAAILLVLVGLFRFSAAQGERDVFLSRFLSPQVFEMARLQGLAAVTQAREVDLTVVCCDLRGFTAYAEAVPSQAVIDLLGEYYDTIGDAVAEVDGTIKDFAGDGILVLVGAPLTRPDHAAVGLVLASLILDVGHRVTAHWATGPHPLGLGVGVASGRVTVGGVGSTGRTEYTAVGAAVNLAARLCSAAADGEILVDERTAELTGINGLEPRGAMQLKGLSHEVAVFAVLEARSGGG